MVTKKAKAPVPTTDGDGGPNDGDRRRPVERSVEGLLELLERDGLITGDQAREALMRAPMVAQQLRRKAGRDSARWSGNSADPAAVIAAMGMRDGRNEPIDEDRVAETFARHAGFRYVKLDPLKLDPRLVTETLTLPFARRHTVLPVSMNERRIVVATDNPYDASTLEQIRSVSGRDVEVWIAARSDVLKILRDIYGFRASVSQAANEISGNNELQNLEAFVRLKSGEEIEASDTHVVNAVEYLLRYAIEQAASDIHIEPHRSETHVRMRIDGMLHQVYKVPAAVHPPIASRIKSMGRLDIAERRRPQDGRIKTVHQDREVELRISTLPVAFGEKIVVRILDPGTLLRDVGELGMFRRQAEIFRSLIYRPHGLVLVTGPTGSGKTTSLYSALRDLAAPEINVTTIEDPIEMVVDAFNQVAVNPRIELDFASALRTILRQDPDIIMVGEIRDVETARMAIQAALTGHLVLSTVHTNDAAGAVTRLIDLGVQPYLVSSTLVGVVAQRLVRQICARCKEKFELTAAQCRELNIPLSGGRPPKLAVYEGAGCARCRETGYRGRLGVYELLRVTPQIREKIAEDVTTEDLRKAALADGMMTLREAAIKKMAQGVTTFGEVLRVTATGE